MIRLAAPVFGHTSRSALAWICGGAALAEHLRCAKNIAFAAKIDEKAAQVISAAALFPP